VLFEDCDDEFGVLDCFVCGVCGGKVVMIEGIGVWDANGVRMLE